MALLVTFKHLPENIQRIITEIQSFTPQKNGEARTWPDVEGMAAHAIDALQKLCDHSGSDNVDLSDAPPYMEDALDTVAQEITRTYEMFYTHQYSKLPQHLRQLYTDLRLVEFGLLMVKCFYVPETETETVESYLDQMIGGLDRAIIIAGAANLPRGCWIQTELLPELEEAWHTWYRPSATPMRNDPAVALEDPGSERYRQMVHRWDAADDFLADDIFCPPVESPIPTDSGMTTESFRAHLFLNSNLHEGKHCPTPVIIQNHMADWPAMSTHPWRKPDYLLHQTIDGKRLVPVEVGRSYVDENWGQELITFRELLNRMQGEMVARTTARRLSESIGPQPSHTEHTRRDPMTNTYLAQHNLFAQIPDLYNDILIPDLCYTEPPPHPISDEHDKPELPLPDINAWLGPAGTITPLHTDGYHNLLAQVVGSKYIRLYPPYISEDMASRGVDENGINMSNTSHFDVGVYEGWDKPPPGTDPPSELEVEGFKDLLYYDCILREGEMLYIPMGWWHYVRSLSTSFSVSFWFNGDHYERGPPDQRY